MKHVLFLALVACGGHSAAPANPGGTPATCDQAVGNAMKFAPSDVNQAEETPEIVKHCNDDGWSAEVRNCLVAAKTEPELDQCDKMLTPDQSQKVSAHVMAGATGSAGAEGSAAAPPPAP
ncbi:MAG: hypothetical protein QM831_31780 [Kofleriaceae bacterium]